MKDYITGFMHESSDKKPAVSACRTGLLPDQLTVLTDKGERIHAYCTRLCDDLFSEPDDHDVVTLRKDLVGRRVAVEVAIERNAGRIPGPGDGDRIPLVKHIKLLK